MATTTASVPLQDHSYYPKKTMDKFADVSFDQLSCESSQEGELSEKALPNELINFDAILSEVGFMNSIDQIIFQQLLSMYPTGVLNSQVASLGKIESQLANLFRCDVYHHGCHFTAESESSFRSHLESQHMMLTSLYCCYCTKAGHVENCNEASADHASFSQVDHLIAHIKEQHASLNYQCNLCFYRAVSVEHVFIHQAIEHLSNFEATLKQVILDKKQNSELTPIEEQFLLQTNDTTEKSDDETEVEDSDDESDTVSSNVNIPKKSVKELCKIIDCGQAQSGDFKERQNLSVVLGLEKHSNSSALICAYCEYEPKHGEDFLSHVASQHNSLPIKAYNPQPFNYGKFNISALNNLDEEEAEAIVSNFRQQLADNALSRSFDDSLMLAAFNSYSTNEEVSPSKGLKRKLDLAEDESVEVATSESTPKRLRGLLSTVGRFATNTYERIPRPGDLWQTTRRVATRVAKPAGLAVLGVGFYVSTHYLPESLQTYLN